MASRNPKQRHGDLHHNSVTTESTAMTTITLTWTMQNPSPVEVSYGDEDASALMEARRQRRALARLKTIATVSRKIHTTSTTTSTATKMAKTMTTMIMMVVDNMVSCTRGHGEWRLLQQLRQQQQQQHQQQQQLYQQRRWRWQLINNKKRNLT